MRIFIFLTFIVANVGVIRAGARSNCDIEGVDRYDWIGYYFEKTPVLKTHEGVIKTYKTKNILELKGHTSQYFEASFSNDVLSLSTNENFKNFEKEYAEHHKTSFLINLDFSCQDGQSETLQMQQKVQDVNTHDPIFNKPTYEYHFGMPIPENYELSKLLKISARDDDFSNSDMYFTFQEFNDQVKIEYHITSYYADDNDYYTSLKTLKEIRAPFRKEFTIVARDGGDPARNTTALLIVSVTSNGPEEDREGNNQKVPHPPIFAKHLYFANYTLDNGLEVEEPIDLKYGAESDTVIKQSGYQEYFEFELNPSIKGEIQIKTLKPLPVEIIRATKLIVIELEAFNGHLHIPGRTALVIRLPHRRTGDFHETLDECNVTAHATGDSNSAPLILFSIATFTIVLMNVLLLACYFQKRKATVVEPYPTRDSYLQEKF